MLGYAIKLKSLDEITEKSEFTESDANRLFAALIKDSIARKILFHPSLKFIAPDYILVELSNHKKELLKKSKLPEEYRSR